VDHQQPGGLGTGVAEGVGSAARDEHEALASDGELVAVDDDGDHPVENEVGLGAVRVAVRRRTASARGQGALHQRQVTAVELGGGLEEHLAAASTVVRVTFAGTKNHRGRLLTSMLHGIAVALDDDCGLSGDRDHAGAVAGADSLLTGHSAETLGKPKGPPPP
jgi:hypothetical protein